MNSGCSQYNAFHDFVNNNQIRWNNEESAKVIVDFPFDTYCSRPVHYVARLSTTELYLNLSSEDAIRELRNKW